MIADGSGITASCPSPICRPTGTTVPLSRAPNRVALNPETENTLSNFRSHVPPKKPVVSNVNVANAFGPGCKVTVPELVATTELAN